MFDISDLLRRCIAMEEPAWLEFQTRFHRLIAGTATMFSDTGHADDATQAVYERLIQDDCRLLRRFSGCYEQFLIYLKRISKNVAKTWSRNQRQRIRLVSEALDLDLVVDTSAGDPEALYLDQETLSELDLVLDDLRPEYRAVLLYHARGYRFREIAEIMAVPLRTVLTWCSRARRQARDRACDLKLEKDLVFSK